jgi:hypothetical protein
MSPAHFAVGGEEARQDEGSDEDVPDVSGFQAGDSGDEDDAAYISDRHKEAAERAAAIAGAEEEGAHPCFLDEEDEKAVSRQVNRVLEEALQANVGQGDAEAGLAEDAKALRRARARQRKLDEELAAARLAVPLAKEPDLLGDLSLPGGADMSFDWLNDGDEGAGADGSAAGSTAHGPVPATPGKPYAGQCFSSFEAA